MSAVKKLAVGETYLETGVVERVAAVTTRAGGVPVRLSAGVFEAARAKSCLVVPEAGDRVLCAIEADTVYVLAVLEGRADAGTRIVAEGDLHLQARGGRAVVHGSEAVDITAGGPIGVTGPELHVRAEKGSVAIEELGFFGRLVQAEVSKVALLAQEVDSVMTRLSQRAKRVFRFVEEVDQTRAGTIDARAEGMLGLRAENAVISARVLAKVDGEQIHIG